MNTHFQSGSGRASSGGQGSLCFHPHPVRREPLWGLVARQGRHARQDWEGKPWRPSRPLRGPFRKMAGTGHAEPGRAGGGCDRVDEMGWAGGKMTGAGSRCGILRGGCSILAPRLAILSPVLAILRAQCAILSTGFAILRAPSAILRTT